MVMLPVKSMKTQAKMTKRGEERVRERSLRATEREWERDTVLVSWGGLMFRCGGLMFRSGGEEEVVESFEGGPAFFYGGNGREFIHGEVL